LALMGMPDGCLGAERIVVQEQGLCPMLHDNCPQPDSGHRKEHAPVFFYEID